MGLHEMTGWRREAAGFTLLELLVAMVLMVVVGSSLYTALHTGFRAHRSALLAVEPTLQAINAIELLKQDIRGVLPPGDGLVGPFIGADARGLRGVDLDSLEFYTTSIYAPGDMVSGGVGRIELLLDEDEDYRHPVYTYYRLVRRVTTNLLAPRVVEPEEQVLCRRVLSLNFRYFDGTTWVDFWDSTEDNRLPQAVEIDIRVAHGDRYDRNLRNRNTEPETRRLVQSFIIPCEASAAQGQ